MKFYIDNFSGFMMEMNIDVFRKWSESWNIVFANVTSWAYFYWVVFNFVASVFNVINQGKISVNFVGVCRIYVSFEWY